MDRSGRFFVQSTSVLLIVGLFTLLGIVGMTYWLGMRAQVYFDDVLAARDARAVAVEFRSALQTAESSQRGFLVTGNEIYLAPYDTAAALAKRQLPVFQENFKPYEQLAPLVERLTTILADKIVEMDETISLKRQGRGDEAAALFRSNRGKALMDEANVLFSGAIRAADKRLTEGVGEHRDNAAWLRLVSIIGGIVIVGTVGAASYAVVQHTRDLAEARDAVAASNLDLEARVRSRTQDLSRANDEVQRFAYIVTHDLRAPLVNIMGFTSELETGTKSVQALLAQAEFAGDVRPMVRDARLAADEEIPEAIGFIRSSTKKMDELINAILRISREGRRTLRPESIQLSDLVNTSAAALRHTVRETGGSIDIRLDLPPIVSDRMSLEQAFGNVMDNAVKYQAKDRPIAIAVSGGVLDNEHLVIEVTDNGRGIAEQDLERVFELFRRAGVQDRPGEGIGLAHVRTVLRNLGGDITVTSRLAEGTTFQIVIPRMLTVGEGGAA